MRICACKRKKERRTGRSRDPDQGAYEATTARRPIQGRGTSGCLRMDQEPCGSGWSILWRQNLTLARHSKCVMKSRCRLVRAISGDEMLEISGGRVRRRVRRDFSLLTPFRSDKSLETGGSVQVYCLRCVRSGATCEATPYNSAYHAAFRTRSDQQLRLRTDRGFSVELVSGLFCFSVHVLAPA